MKKMASKTKLKCGKCGQIYYHEDNLGTLMCFDTYYTINHEQCFKVKADHKPSVGMNKLNIYNWQDWVWSIDDCEFVEVNLLKKRVPQPDKLSIVVLEEFNNMNNNYMEKMVEDDVKKKNTSTQMILVGKKKTSVEDDFEYDSYDEELFQKEIDDDQGYSDLCISEEGIIKEVCIARFDWREKFKILLQIKRIDNEIERRDHRPMRSVPYYETLEFKNNPELRKQFLDRFYS